MTICLCGATGFYNRRELAQHIIATHGANAPRALTLAQKLVDKLKLAAEEYAVFGVEPPAVTRAPSAAERLEAQARELGLPSDEQLNRAIAAAVTAAPPAAPLAPPPRRRSAPSSGEAAGSRSSSTPAPPAISPAPEDTTMAKPEKPCRVCARLTKKAGAPTKCKRHGGVGHPKSAAGSARTATGGGKAPKPRPAKAVSRNGAGKLDAMLTAAKASVTTLREELARAEVRVAVLMELAGS